MFASDNNVETIAQLVEVLKHYIGLQSEYVRLDVIEKIVRLLTAIAVVSVLSLLLVIALIYFSFAAVYAIAPLTGSMSIAFVIIGGAYVVFILLFVMLRHKLIERPLVKFLASILMSK